MKGFIKQIKSNLLNIPTWRSEVPILVIESDDWGSIRMSSAKAVEGLRAYGHPVDQNPYHLNDGLETDSDVKLLAKVLGAVTNKLDESAVFTLNYCLANPSFDEIKKDDFQRYYRESIADTYRHYGESLDVISIVKQGEANKVFDVEFHGTEHLNINRWMKALRNNEAYVHQAFNYGVFSPAVSNCLGYSMEYMDALDYDSIDEIDYQLKSLSIGVKLFQNIWDKKPKSFIAPCYRWSKAIEKWLFENDIKYIQGQRAQLHPKNEVGFKQRKIFRYTGQQNKLGQLYTVRNVIFEPSIHGPNSALDLAKNQIEYSFKHHLPAIVSSHRINYTSRINLNNREQGLDSLQRLLKWLVEKYPNVQFLSSSELGERIYNSTK